MILINVLRTFYYLFKFLFCDLSKKKQEQELEDYFKLRKNEDLTDLKRINKEMRSENSQSVEWLVNKLEELRERFQERLGRYVKILEFITNQRLNIYKDIQKADSLGHKLDLIEKYCIFRDLIEQIKNQRLRPLNQKSIQQSSSMDQSFDQLKIEDELEEQYHKFSLCYDIVEVYGKSDVENHIIDLFQKEIIDENKEEVFEQYIKTQYFSKDDLRFTNRIKELIQSRNIEIYEQKIESKKMELQSLKQSSIQTFKQINVQLGIIDNEFKEKGIYEYYDKIKDQPAESFIKKPTFTQEVFQQYYDKNQKQQNQVQEMLNNVISFKKQQKEKVDQNQESFNKLNSDLESQSVYLDEYQQHLKLAINIQHQ